MHILLLILKLSIIEIHVSECILYRDKEWIKSQKMESFLSVAKGSVEPPVFLEMEYKGTNSSSSPVALVGKGVTFDRYPKLRYAVLTVIL